MQDDGNFVVYDAQGRDRFATATVGNTGAHLAVQNDGNVVVYRTDGTSPWDRISAEAAQLAVHPARQTEASEDR
jgi:hypothetical protein